MEISCILIQLLRERTFHTQYEPGFIVAREKSPLELLIENKELFDK